MINRNKSFLFLSALLIITTLACGLENIQVVESPNLEATITAQALLIQQGLPTATVAENQVVVVVTATLDPAASTVVEETVAPAPVVQVTAPAGAVTVTVSTATNCRNGPGQNFSIVYGMPIGQVAEVVAKNTFSGYWIIKIPNGNGTTCWLWGQYATVTGNTASLNEVVTPTSAATKKPTSTSTGTLVSTATRTVTLAPTATRTITPTSAPVVTKPNAPTINLYSVGCPDPDGDGSASFVYAVGWLDNSNNEKGFTVSSADGDFSYPANTTIHHGSFDWFVPLTFDVTITAFNDAGQSSPTIFSITCP